MIFRRSLLSIFLITILRFQDCISGTSTGNKTNSVTKLRTFLLSDYDALARPVQNVSKATLVTVDFTPYHLTEVSEYEGSICVEAWIDMSWEDEHLRWNPKDYQELTVVHFSQEEIWKPDITVFERRYSYTNQLNERVMLEVNHRGKVSWFPGATINLVCKLNYQNFPHDTQDCQMYLVPWTHTVKEIDIKVKHENVTRKYFVSSNPNWILESVSGTGLHITINSEEIVLVKYHINLKRRASIDRLITNIPYVASKVLLLAMFWVPVHSRNKFFLGCAALVIEISVLFFTEYMLPSPSAGQAALPHLRVAIYTGVVGVLLQVLVTNVSRIRKQNAPAFLNALTSGLIGNCLCLCTVDFPEITHQQMETNSLPKLQCSRDREWYIVATLVDRCFFILLLLTFIVECCLM